MIREIEYQIVKNEVPNDIEFGTIFNINTNKVTEFTHGFHKYPAKFIPQIPRWALNRYLKDIKSLVLDPFCGSGTTIIETLLHGHSGFGVDVDPLSVLISKVKTTPLDIEELNKEVTKLENNLLNKDLPIFKPACETIEHWFKKEYIPVLSKIRDTIDKIENRDIKDLFLICFSSILRKVSNADDQSQKAYVSHTKIKDAEHPLPIFLNQIKYYQERITQFSNSIDENVKSKVKHGSCINDLPLLTENKLFDLAITSPPYIKAIDYIYNQMVELFWLGDLFELDTQTKQNKKKKLYIGNKQVLKQDFVDYSPFIELTNVENLDTKLQSVFQQDIKNGFKHSYVTYRYFVEMELHFQQVSNVLKKEAHYVLVVGDSTVSDIYFETADYLIEIAERNGFTLTNKWGYKIKNRYMRFDRKGRGGIIEIDWVLDFVKQ